MIERFSAGICLLVALVALVALGCSSSSSPSSSSSGAFLATVRAQCNEVASSVCTRAIDACGIMGQGTSADCTTQGTNACCKTSCDVAAISDETAVKTCVSDVDATTCPTLWDGQSIHLPASCKGVIKRPASERGGGGAGELGAALSSEE